MAKNDKTRDLKQELESVEKLISEYKAYRKELIETKADVHQINYYNCIIELNEQAYKRIQREIKVPKSTFKKEKIKVVDNIIKKVDNLLIIKDDFDLLQAIKQFDLDFILRDLSDLIIKIHKEGK